MNRLSKLFYVMVVAAAGNVRWVNVHPYFDGRTCENRPAYCDVPFGGDAKQRRQASATRSGLN